MPDKFSAVWVSHSSIADFKRCPRRYYLGNVYKDPRSHHKVTLVSPALSLGSAVHEVLESLSVLPTAERFKISLLERFAESWSKVSGVQGGFEDKETEAIFRKRGEDMLRRVMAHPGPLERLAVKIKQDLPHYWLSEGDNIVLCGKLDWLEYDEVQDAVSVLDFKTGKNDEPVDSLQLPIYLLLAHNCQTRPVKKLSYWYIDRDDVPLEQKMPEVDRARETVLKVAKEIKLARALERFKCPEGEGGCKYCRPYEKIIKGDAQFVGVDATGRDVYSLAAKNASILPESEIL